MNRWLLAFLFLSLPLLAENDPCDEDEDQEECVRKRIRYEDEPDSSILRDEIRYPSENKDPFLESLSR